ncbi:MAG: protein-L-isoaspartate O-methyltransferase [Pseudomonadota bacterium]
MNVQTARRQMVLQQVRSWDVFDERVLDVMQDIPREAFVPEAWRSAAFADAPVPIGHGETTLFPSLEGRLLQALMLTPDCRVLEVGSGSGYLSACLGRLASTVMGIERHADLAQRASHTLEALSINNVQTRVDHAAQQLPQQRFDAILLGGSVATSTARFETLLNEGGRLVGVIGSGPVMHAMRITRISESRWQRETLFETCIEPLAGFELTQQLAF